MFDGSAKDQNQCSLNDCLEKGPNLIPHIFNILLRFQTYPVGIIADIEKAFHQIVVNSADRDMLRFLWLEDINDERTVEQYRFCRLVFGLTPSPAILNTVIHHHLARKCIQEPQIIKLLAKSLYVDDFMGGANDVNEAFEVYQKTKRIMSEGGFNLRKWNTNSNVLRERMCNTTEFEAAKLPMREEVKILGLKWDTIKDELQVDVSELLVYIGTLTPTKRSLLRFSSKLFDPLEFISPFVVRLKILFQNLCFSKVEWDEKLDGKALVSYKNSKVPFQFERPQGSILSAAWV